MALTKRQLLEVLRDISQYPFPIFQFPDPAAPKPTPGSPLLPSKGYVPVENANFMKQMAADARGHEGPHFYMPVPEAPSVMGAGRTVLLPELPEGYPFLGGERGGKTARLTACPPEGRPFSKATMDAIVETGRAAARMEDAELLGQAPLRPPTPILQARGVLKDHYKQHPAGIECIDVIEHFSFNIGTAIKYLWRADHKGSRAVDLEKAKYYIDRELKRMGTK